MIRGKLINKKGLISFIILIALLTGLYLIPMRADNVYINLITQNVDDNIGITFEIHSKEAYEEVYSYDTVVSGNVASVRLDYEYITFDKIAVKNTDVAQSVIGLKVLATGIDRADYIASYMDGVILEEKDGEYVFNEEALNTVREGINNPWYLKIIIAVIVVFVYILVLMYAAIKKNIGRFEAIVIFSAALFSAVCMGVFKINRLLDKEIVLRGHSFDNGWIVYAVTLLFISLLSLCVICHKESKAAKYIIISVYALILILSIFKMCFYSEKVANTPDEKAHISYVAYLEQSGEIVPEFKNINACRVIYDDNETMQLSFVDNTVCYLNHPPLYYHLMRLANGIEFNEDGSFNVNVDKMRIFSMSFVVLALIIMFYLGYTRIKKIPIYHLLFAMVCTSVPMMMYSASGIGNDSLTVLTFTVFFLGIIRYIEKKRTFLTYLLIAFGISTTLLTKMTAGIMVVIIGLVVLISSIIKEKTAKELLTPGFLLTIFIYLVPIVYYLYMYVTYGGFHPDIFAMNPEYSRQTGFYVPVLERTEKGVIEYIWYFIYNFKKTWTGISSHISLLKSEDIWFSVQNIGLVLIWFFPALLFIKSLRKKLVYSGALLAAYFSVAITFIMQLMNGYNGYITRGYRGSFQSRYYLCVIVVFAFCITLIVQKVMELLDGKGVYANIIQKCILSMTVIYIALLAFEDFIYFLINYTNYLS